MVTILESWWVCCYLKPFGDDCSWAYVIRADDVALPWASVPVSPVHIWSPRLTAALVQHQYLLNMTGGAVPGLCPVSLASRLWRPDRFLTFRHFSSDIRGGLVSRSPLGAQHPTTTAQGCTGVGVIKGITPFSHILKAPPVYWSLYKSHLNTSWLWAFVSSNLDWSLAWIETGSNPYHSLLVHVCMYTHVSHLDAIAPN